MFICLNCLIDKYLALQIRMNPNTDEAGGCEESEDEESSESSSLDANMLRSKFASLASTLQQTNQNLVTFEYLLENNKKVRKLTESPKVGGGGEAEEDIVNLLKDICGSVQDLRTEMGQNTAAESKNPDLDQNKGKKKIILQFRLFKFLILREVSKAGAGVRQPEVTAGQV